MIYKSLSYNEYDIIIFNMKQFTILSTEMNLLLIKK